MTTSQTRRDVDRFSSTTNAISAGPCVAVGWLSFIHDGRDGMLHAHSRFVWIRTVPFPPAELTDNVLTSSVTPQRPDGGDGVSRVVDEDPQAAAIQPRTIVSANDKYNRPSIRTCLDAGRQRAMHTCAFTPRLGILRRDREQQARAPAPN